MYKKTLHAGWGDMDFNSHMRNTACLDKSADIRMMIFTEHGFPMSEFFRSNGKLAARVTSTGGWLDLSLRKLVPARVGLLEALRELPRTSDFQQLPTSIK